MKIDHGDTKLTLAVIGVIVLSFCSYWLGTYVQQSKYATFVESFQVIRENSGKYRHINPRVGGISNTATDIGVFVDIKSDIVKFLSKEEKNGNLFGYSFYIRDLNTGLWFGENEDVSDFFPASLFKLPIAIAAYKQAEDDPSFLKRQVVYTEELQRMNNQVQLNAESTLVVGNVYTVETLVEKMLTLSDNGAKDLIISVLNQSYINQLFDLVSIVDPTESQKYEVSSRKYAHFLNILYGSSYLNEDHSELLLGMLAESTFKDGIAGGVPKGVGVAHKFGIYQFEEKIDNASKFTTQLHDCGVIYHDKPYIFCFMTKGKDEKALYNVISSVSRMVYEYQEKHNNPN